MLEAGEVGELFVKISADTQGFKDGMRQLAATAQTQGKEVGRAVQAGQRQVAGTVATDPAFAQFIAGRKRDEVNFAAWRTQQREIEAAHYRTWLRGLQAESAATGEKIGKAIVGQDGFKAQLGGMREGFQNLLGPIRLAMSAMIGLKAVTATIELVSAAVRAWKGDEDALVETLRNRLGIFSEAYRAGEQFAALTNSRLAALQEETAAVYKAAAAAEKYIVAFEKIGALRKSMLPAVGTPEEKIGATLAGRRESIAGLEAAALETTDDPGARRRIRQEANAARLEAYDEERRALGELGKKRYDEFIAADKQRIADADKAETTTRIARLRLEGREEEAQRAQIQADFEAQMDKARANKNDREVAALMEQRDIALETVRLEFAAAADERAKAFEEQQRQRKEKREAEFKEFYERVGQHQREGEERRAGELTANMAPRAATMFRQLEAGRFSYGSGGLDVPASAMGHVKQQVMAELSAADRKLLERIADGTNGKGAEVLSNN